MRCDNCGKSGIRTRHLSRTYGRGKEVLLVEAVPVMDCPACGESYLTAETLHELERIKLHRRSFARTRPVQVTEFAASHAGVG